MTFVLTLITRALCTVLKAINDRPNQQIGLFNACVVFALVSFPFGDVCPCLAQEQSVASSTESRQKAVVAKDSGESSSDEANAPEGEWGAIPPAEALFALQIQPLFAEKCEACHGRDPDDIQGGLDLTNNEAFRRGGDSFGEEILIANDAASSLLYRVVCRTEEGYEMPPKEAEQFSEEQQQWILSWIEAGAPWPSEDRIEAIRAQSATGVRVTTSGGQDKSWTDRLYEAEKLWAYRPIRAPEVPSDQHPIDWLVERKLADQGITPAPMANSTALVRRISFGLTGLPPTPEQTDEFTQGFRQDPKQAVTQLVDRLLDTPQYGEHFGRHWLDVVRYADTSGFANDYSRPNAWRYRDYVVRSFNTDKPFDQFVREQIAGDEYDDQSPEHLIATGFLRMGPWEQTGMSVFKVTRQQWLDDVTDSVGQTFLAHALQCARCHDHKFDPIPTRDYYSFQSVFATTQFAEVDAPFLDSENLNGFDEAQAWTKQKIKGYEEQRDLLNKSVASARKKESGDAKVGDNGLAPGDEASLARMSKNIARHRWELEKTEPIAFTVYTGKTIERKNIGARLTLPESPWGRGYLEETAVLSGGDVFSPAESVSPAPLSAAESLGSMSTSDFPANQGPRRKALAEWIVATDNPLTARVIANRVWSWHFGKGLAGNPNNFGSTGAVPTHPELLDFLAKWLMANDWSIKKLNRMILTSRTYLRSTQHPNPELLAERDPNRQLYAVFLSRRLTAEEMRDAQLAASGELNRQVGGIPCRPDINLEVAFQPRQIMGGTASVYEPNPLPEQRNRRSIYCEKIRGLRDPFMEIFNQPGPDKSCELRETSTVAPQALTMMNSVENFERALALANRIAQQTEDERQAIVLAFRLLLSRGPSKAEIDACLVHWKESNRRENEISHAPQEIKASIARTVMAEKTGEPYDFVEHMPAYESYVPDLQPHEVDARTRGLAQVCLVLLNSNEFLYID